MKKSRIISFIIMMLSYIFGIVLSIICYKLLLPINNVFIKILITDVIVTIFIYLVGIIFNNASLYDPYWSVQPLVIVLSLLLMTNKITLYSITTLIVVFLWGIRLTANWAYTFKNLNNQDWRYTMLKEKCGKLYQIVNLLGINMFPTIVVYLCMLPVINFFVNVNNLEIIDRIFYFFGMIIAILGIMFELISDINMHKFRKNKENKGMFINVGMWKKSRHPNYLGEILMWWGIAIALSITINPLLIIGALVNTLMFIFISIPMAEKHLASYKDGFLEYKERTRMLLP